MVNLDSQISRWTLHDFVESLLSVRLHLRLFDLSYEARIETGICVNHVHLAFELSNVKSLRGFYWRRSFQWEHRSFLWLHESQAHHVVC